MSKHDTDTSDQHAAKRRWLNAHEEGYHKAMGNRQVQMIAIGGAIGTGLFLGAGARLQMAGPALALVYLICGLFSFFILRALGELVLHRPSSGSFVSYAREFLGEKAAYVAGWMYFINWAMTGIVDITAVALYMHYWGAFGGVPQWVFALAALTIVGTMNMIGVKWFAEMEFWFAMIKIVAIVSLIVVGLVMVAMHFQSPTGVEASFAHLWNDGGWFPKGLSGFFAGFQIAVFAFVGIELVGTTAAETKDPEKSLPRAINSIPIRIIMFYVFSLIVIMSVTPWSSVVPEKSPFVELFVLVGLPAAASVINFVVLTSAASSANSGVFSTSRMLFGLAQQGNAPKALASVDKRGVPVNTILVSALVTALCVLINYLAPESAFGLLMALVVSALVINWAMISLAHMKFRRAKQEQGVVTRFPALLYPLGNWICLLFMAAVLVIMLMTPGMAISVYLIPVWLIVLGIGYLFKEKTAKAVKAH